MKALFITFLAFWALQAFSAEPATSTDSTWQRVEEPSVVPEEAADPRQGNQHTFGENIDRIGGELGKTWDISMHKIGVRKGSSTATGTSTSTN